MAVDNRLKIEIPSQGWRQFLTARKEMLDSFDRAREQARSHEVETYHGKVAEAELRNWLSTFLPKRYGVTPGYIVSPGLKSSEKTPHYDVIIYDQLESPVLWVEQSPDTSASGSSRAIPVEFVRCVLEVKASFSPATVTQAMEHLSDLLPLLQGPDEPHEKYRLHLPSEFCCGLVFFDLKREHEYSEAALNKIIGAIQFRGFFGGVILRGEGHSTAATGKFLLLNSRTPIEGDIGRGKQSLLSGMAMGQSVRVTDDIHFGAALLWAEHHFSQFGFDVIAMMQGKYDVRRLSSFHGMGSSQMEARQ